MKRFGLFRERGFGRHRICGTHRLEITDKDLVAKQNQREQGYYPTADQVRAMPKDRTRRFRGVGSEHTVALFGNGEVRI